MLFIWRVYVVFLSWMTLNVYMATGLRYTGLPHVFDYLDMAETVLEFMGVYGFVFRFRTFSQTFWKITTPILIAWDVILGFTQPANVSQAAVGILLALPLYLALYFYAYKSKAFWAE